MTHTVLVTFERRVVPVNTIKGLHIYAHTEYHYREGGGV